MESTEEPRIDQLNRKAYIRGWERKAPPEEEEISCWFCEFAKDAATWETALLAGQARSILNIGVTIPSLQVGMHSLRNFAVEAFANKFVIFCSGRLSILPAAHRIKMSESDGSTSSIKYARMYRLHMILGLR